MKKALVWIGALALIASFLALGLFHLARRGEALDASSKAYADRTIPLIVSTWSEQALLQNASPEFLRAAPKAELDRYFAAFAKLGPLVHYDGAKGQSTMAEIAGKGEIVTARYAAHAEFAHGAAEIDLGIVQRQGHWKIFAFHVDSPQLL